MNKMILHYSAEPLIKQRLKFLVITQVKVVGHLSSL